MNKLIRNIALWVLLTPLLLLSATSANAQCAFQSITYGQTVNGSLSATDCTDDVFGTLYYADYYQFTGSAGDKIAIQMSSTSFDTWLVLIFPSGNMTNNDNGGGGTNARIPATSGYYTLPESGTYLLEATSYVSNTTGSYTLSIAKEAVSGAGMLNLVNGWNLLGNSSSTALNVASVFGDPSKVTTVWKWIAQKANWAFYTPTQTDGGAAYAASKGYDLMTAVAGGEGFWVNAKTPFTAALPTGTAIDSASFKNLASEWSLIATGDNKTPITFNNALSATTPAAGQIPNNFTSLWAWDTALAKWYLYVPSLDATGGLAAYIQTNGYLDFTASNKKLGQGIGFWVNKGGSTGSTPIGPTGGTVQTGNIKIVIPSGAVSHPVTISITPGQADTRYTSLSDAFNMTFQDSAGTAFDIADFARDVQIEISLKSTIPSGSSSKYFLMINSPDGYSLIPASLAGNTVRATLPGTSTTSPPALQNAVNRLASPGVHRNNASLGLPIYVGKIVMAVSTDSEHFTYYYHDNDNISLINATKANLEEAYKKLNDYGFSWTRYGNCRFDKTTFTPYKMPVYFSDLGGVDPITYGRYGGSGFYSPCTYYWSKYIEMNTNPNALTDSVKAKGYTAHELFHFLQAIYVNSATDFRWIDEASSVWLQNTIANPTNGNQCFSDTWTGFNFTARGLFNPFSSALGYTADIDQQHGYAAAAFLLYADAKGYFSINKLWDALRNSQGEVSAFKSSMSKDLATVWSEYAEDFYSGKDLSYIKGGKCINGIAYVYTNPLTIQEKFTALPFNFKRNIDLYEFSATPYMLQYVNSLSATTDVTFQVKNLIANQKVEIYSYSVVGGPAKLGEITKDAATLTTKGLDLKGKIISIILIDTNIPASASPSTGTGGRFTTLEVTVYGGPTITSLLPATGVIGAPVTIVGIGFGATQGTSKLTFGVTTATVLTWADKQITTTVPTGAAPGNVSVIVEVNSIKSNAMAFNVGANTVPVYVSFSPPEELDKTKCLPAGPSEDPDKCYFVSYRLTSAGVDTGFKVVLGQTTNMSLEFGYWVPTAARFTVNGNVSIPATGAAPAYRFLVNVGAGTFSVIPCQNYGCY